MHASKILGIALATLLVAACDNGSNEPPPPPPPGESHYLIVNVDDPGVAGAETGDYLFVKPNGGKSVKSVSFDIAVPSGSPWNGIMVGQVDGGWSAGWNNSTKDGAFHTYGYALSNLADDGTNGFGFKLAVGGGATGTDASNGSVWVDNVVLTYSDDSTQTYDFDDGVVPGAFATKTDNSAGTATLSLSIGTP
jgi:hypothetical protein